MAKSIKPIFWSLFAAGGTVAAFLAPVMALLIVLVALGHVPTHLHYESFHAFAAHWLGKIVLFGVIALFLWHAAHRLRGNMHDLGLRQDTLVAWVLYLGAGLGTVLSAYFLLQI